MKKEFYLGHPYGVLPKWLQFIIFIHSGLFNGGGGWRWKKLKRINCWSGKHIYQPEFNKCKDGRSIKILDSVRSHCTQCGYIKKIDTLQD